MADNDVHDLFRRFLTEESNRGLGDIPLRATAAHSSLSPAEMEAATGGT